MDAAPLWMPTSEEDAYLHDVLQYTKEMPKGKMRGLMMRMLYSATSYCGDVETVGSIRDIQAAASTLMTGDDRRSVQLGVQNARAERAALLEKLNAAQRSSRPAPASGPANDASEKLSELKKQREAYLRAQEGRTTKSQPQNTP
jgi:hypothetical protein